MPQQTKLKRKAPWTEEEDDKLRNYVREHGACNWNVVALNLDIGRSKSSCRHRWNNELSLEVRRGSITDEEMLRILELYGKWGNKWSRIAREFPGRTDNEIKNCWNSQLTREAMKHGYKVESYEFLQFMRARI